MARHKKIQAPEDDEPGLDISSLIDVCFLLLIYFLVTTRIVKKEQELNTTLPVPNLSQPPLDIAPMSLLVEANGRVSIRNETGLIELIESNPDARDLPKLAQRLELYKSAADTVGQKTLVQLHVNDDAVQQRVTDVLNALASAGITGITFMAPGSPAIF